MTARRGITLIELLVAMVLFAIVASLAMMVFSNQNRNYKMESERVEAALMAKGTLDELTRAVRMAGGNLPEGTGGIRIWRPAAETTTFVMNERGGIDTILSFRYDSTTRRLGLKVSSSKRFGDNGYAVVPLIVPPSPVTKHYILPVTQRFTGMCGDSLVLDASPLNAVGAISTFANLEVHSLDSLTFWKRSDTLFLERNRRGGIPFAVGVDTLQFLYWHRTAGWLDSLLPTSTPETNRRFDKVRIRLVMRNQTFDAKLFQRDPNSRGYTFSALQTEVSLRNPNLVNR